MSLVPLPRPVLHTVEDSSIVPQALQARHSSSWCSIGVWSIIPLRVDSTNGRGQPTFQPVTKARDGLRLDDVEALVRSQVAQRLLAFKQKAIRCLNLLHLLCHWLVGVSCSTSSSARGPWLFLVLVCSPGTATAPAVARGLDWSTCRLKAVEWLLSWIGSAYCKGFELRATR